MRGLEQMIRLHFPIVGQTKFSLNYSANVFEIALGIRS